MFKEWIQRHKTKICQVFPTLLKYTRLSKNNFGVKDVLNLMIFGVDIHEFSQTVSFCLKKQQHMQELFLIKKNNTKSGWKMC